jgi:hypothetical protein
MRVHAHVCLQIPGGTAAAAERVRHETRSCQVQACLTQRPRESPSGDHEVTMPQSIFLAHQIIDNVVPSVLKHCSYAESCIHACACSILQSRCIKFIGMPSTPAVQQLHLHHHGTACTLHSPVLSRASLPFFCTSDLVTFCTEIASPCT